MMAAGAFAYIASVTQRTTIGVAGVAATDRFHVSAAILSVLAVVQLAVYAGMQVPVGLLIDRLGPRFLLIAGTTVMILGQLTVAVSEQISWAITGRILVGLGDAMIFTAALRLINTWFPPRLIPQLTQWLGNFGQGGQILSAVPFALILQMSGWSRAFVSSAGLSVIALIVIIVCVRDRPHAMHSDRAAVSWHDTLRRLRISLSQPGTQLGFWSHFVTQSSGTMFTLMWGVPFMVFALGYSQPVAAGLLIVCAVAAVISGPLLGTLTHRFPLRRSDLVVGIVVLLALVWGVVLFWPGAIPLWMLIVLLVVIGIGGPGSLIGLDFARTSNPSHSLGSANGIVNSAGFFASLIMIFLIGVVLDAQVSGRSPGELYSLDSFRVAFSVQFLVIGVGVIFLVRARRRTRHKLRVDDGITVDPLWKVWNDRRKRP